MSARCYLWNMPKHCRPDQDEMEDAINQFLVQLEKQEKKGFKDRASMLSQLPKPAQGSVSSMSVADAI